MFKKKLSIKQVEKELDDYNIEFSALFKFKRLNQLFYNFLKQEMNSDPWDFLRQINDIGKLNAKKANAKKTKIIATFIESDSKQELNLPARIKKKILSSASSTKTTQDVVDIFKKARKSVLKETQNDNFRRFIRTKEFYQICRKKYMFNPKVMTLTVAKNLNFTPSDFINPFFHAKDIALAKFIASDSLEWKLKFSEKFGKLYTSERNYFPGIDYLKNNKFVKLECLIPYNLKKAVINMFPLVDGYFGNYGGLNNIDTYKYYKKTDVPEKQGGVSFEKHPVVLYSSYYDYGKAVAKNLLSATGYFDEKTGIMHSVIKPWHDEKTLGKYPYDYSKKIPCDYYDPAKGKIRKIKCNVGTPVTFVSFKEINDDTTLFTSSFVYPVGSLDIAKFGKYLAKTASATAKKILSAKSVKMSVDQLDGEKDLTVQILKEIQFEKQYDAYKLKNQKVVEFDDVQFTDDTSTDMDADVDDEDPSFTPIEGAGEENEML